MPTELLRQQVKPSEQCRKANLSISGHEASQGRKAFCKQNGGKPPPLTSWLVNQAEMLFKKGASGFLNLLTASDD